MFKKFTVNTIPFEVPTVVYEEYFTLHGTSGLFQNVDDYVIETTATPEVIEESIKSFICELIILSRTNYSIDQRNMLTGEKMFVSNAGEDNYEAFNLDIPDAYSRLDASVIIEFVDKYIIEPRDVITAMIPSINILDFEIDDSLNDTEDIIRNIGFLEPILGPALGDLISVDSRYATHNTNKKSSIKFIMGNKCPFDFDVTADKIVKKSVKNYRKKKARTTRVNNYDGYAVKEREDREYSDPSDYSDDSGLVYSECSIVDDTTISKKLYNQVHNIIYFLITKYGYLPLANKQMEAYFNYCIDVKKYLTDECWTEDMKVAAQKKYVECLRFLNES